MPHRRPVLRFVMILPMLISWQALAQVASQEYGATRLEFSVRGGTGFVIKPNHSETGNSRPWLWYAPTFVRATPQIGKYPNQSLTWLFTPLLEHGVWIAGVDVGESWGNSRGRKAYMNFYKYVRKQFSSSARPCLLAQSRGGMMLFNWAPEHPHDVECMAGIYPVTNLAGWPDLGGEKIQQAYGMGEAELRKRLAKINPIDRLSPLARAHVPLFLIHGDADKVVLLTPNSLEFSRRYSAVGGKVDVEVVHGKGHEEFLSSFSPSRCSNSCCAIWTLAHLRFQAVSQPFPVRRMIRGPFWHGTGVSSSHNPLLRSLKCNGEMRIGSRYRESVAG